jgi:hypothetical protein
MNYNIVYLDAFLSRTRPGIDAPAVMDTKFAKTAAKIIVGIDEGLNQFTAIFIGVFKMNILPNAAQHDPIIHHYG